MRTIIKLTMTGVVLMAATSLFAETDGATALDFSADSAYSQARTNDAKSYHFGKREVIFDDNGIHIMKDRDNFDQSFDDDNFRGNQGGYTPQTNNNGNTSNQNGGNSSSTINIDTSRLTCHRLILVCRSLRQTRCRSPLTMPVTWISNVGFI